MSLRIITGQFKGHHLSLPPFSLTRPTSDRTREGLFNILSHHPDIKLEGAVLLDVFAGSGVFGLEALSRGASFVTFIEKNPAVVKVLKNNIICLKQKLKTNVLQTEALHPPFASKAVDLVFLDPPYKKNLELKTLHALKQRHWIDKQTFLIVESDKHTDLTDSSFIEKDKRFYGQTKISFLKIVV